jgi:spore coat protein U-like protein
VTHLLPWNSGLNAGTGLYTILDFGGWQRTPIYGHIGSGQAVPSGSYSDNPQVVITY